MFTRDVNFAVITNYSRSFLLRRTPGQHLGVEHVIELMDIAVNVEYRVDIIRTLLPLFRQTLTRARRRLADLSPSVHSGLCSKRLFFRRHPLFRPRLIFPRRTLLVVRNRWARGGWGAITVWMDVSVDSDREYCRAGGKRRRLLLALYRIHKRHSPWWTQRRR